MTTVEQFATRMAHAPEVLAAATKDMVRAAALAVATAERGSIAAATRGTSRLSGVGRKGAKLSVGFDVKGATNPTALVAARGPWHLIETDNRPHRIAPRTRNGARALAGHGLAPVASVRHPGTRGKHPWEKGLAVGIPEAEAAAFAAGNAGVAKAFLG